MNKVNSYVIVGCPALTFASPVGTNSILVQPIGDRFAPIEENWKPVGDRNKPIGDGWTPIGDSYRSIGD
ncbi:hypothetical protein ACFO0S_09045 [Chryseomicrobium palamuruense]|uniref:Uncharacterized protein n=1 Tax=Chryseomicrobium palamuruense TaxID=682973 RepID=A0ABV8UV48_9BACL